MLDDAFNSVRDYLTERFSSPLLGAFVVAWSAVNFRIFFILFSDEPVTRKFGLVDVLVFPNREVTLTNGLLLPAVLAFLYVFVYPWPARLVYWYLRWQQKLTLQIKHRMDDETPLTREEVQQFNLKNRERAKEHAREIEERDNEIAALKREVEERDLRERTSSSEAQGETSDDAGEEGRVALSGAQGALLRYAGRLHPAYLSERDLPEGLDSPTGISFALGELTRLGLLHRVAGKVDSYKLTHEGLRFLQEHRAD